MIFNFAPSPAAVAMAATRSSILNLICVRFDQYEPGQKSFAKFSIIALPHVFLMILYAYLRVSIEDVLKKRIHWVFCSFAKNLMSNIS